MSDARGAVIKILHRPSVLSRVFLDSAWKVYLENRSASGKIIAELQNIIEYYVLHAEAYQQTTANNNVLKNIIALMTICYSRLHNVPLLVCYNMNPGIQLQKVGLSYEVALNTTNTDVNNCTTNMQEIAVNPSTKDFKKQTRWLLQHTHWVF